MARKCTVCEHPRRLEIEKALINNEALRSVAKRFGISAAAVLRHKNSHLAKTLLKARDAKEITRTVKVVAEAKAVEAKEQGHAAGLMAELEKCFQKASLLFDACDRWLRDPEDPERYDIGPRAEDVQITLVEFDVDGKPARKKKRLSQILEDLRERTDTEVSAIETKYADPRQLVLKAIGELRELIRLQMDVFKTVYSVEEISKFQQIVVEEIGNAAPEVQREILKRLHDARAIRSIVECPVQSD